MKKLEDRLDERLELGDCDLISTLTSYLESKGKLTGRSALVRQKDTTPSIHDALTERDNVINHVVWEVGAGGNAGGLLENLANNRQVGIEVSADGLADITEALEDGRLQLVGCALYRKLASRSSRPSSAWDLHSSR